MFTTMTMMILRICNSSVSMKLDLLIKLKYQANTEMLYVGIKYFLRDLLFEVSSYTCPAN